eukprot:TRINITY_DN16667_c0_g1_i1.p1 TRINITY_DN16667_c0_g1~~TRINITY_DN16667_c0_g1_i1.p1  ORF type:complete len:742 (+),score=132.17 TRINITY_DN16667_c0_g1_i1:3-2228(+)
MSEHKTLRELVSQVDQIERLVCSLDPDDEMASREKLNQVTKIAKQVEVVILELSTGSDVHRLPQFIDTVKKFRVCEQVVKSLLTESKKKRESNYCKFPMQGFLKLSRDTSPTGRYSNKIWDRFYFRKEGFALVYWTDEQASTPSGSIDLSDMASVDICKKDERIFQIHTPDKTYSFLVDTPVLAVQWMKALAEWRSGNASLLLGELEEFQETLKQKREQDMHVLAEISEEIEKRKQLIEDRKLEKQREREHREERRRQQDLARASSRTLEVKAKSIEVTRETFLREESAPASYSETPSITLSPRQAPVSAPLPTLVRQASSPVIMKRQTPSDLSVMPIKSPKSVRHLPSASSKRDSYVADSQLPMATSLQSVNHAPSPPAVNMRATELRMKLVEGRFKMLSDEFKALTEEKERKEAAELADEQFKKLRAEIEERKKKVKRLQMIEKEYDDRIKACSEISVEERDKEIRSESLNLKQDLCTWNALLPDLTKQAMAKSSKIISLKRTLEAHQTQVKLESGDVDLLVEETQRIIDKEITAQQAHQFQRDLLKYDKRRLIEEHNAAMEQSKSNIEQANQDLIRVRTKLKWFRSYFYLEPERGSLESIIAEIKELYFNSLLLSIKLSMLISGAPVSVPTGDLETEIAEKNISWRDWPNYFASRISGEAAKIDETQLTGTRKTTAAATHVQAAVAKNKERRRAEATRPEWEKFPKWCTRPDLVPEDYVPVGDWKTVDLSGYSLTSVF